MAKVNLYVVYDRLAEESGPIYQAVNDGVALRQYNNLLQNCTCKEDYDCVCIGEFDTQTMSISLIGPKSIIKEA